jgi:hypothetical protein
VVGTIGYPFYSTVYLIVHSLSSVKLAGSQHKYIFVTIQLGLFSISKLRVFLTLSVSLHKWREKALQKWQDELIFRTLQISVICTIEKFRLAVMF